MSKWLIYVRHCPLCQQGLCRVRVCKCDNVTDTFVVCDECDATWRDTQASSQIKQSNPADAQCPSCEQSLWGPSSHWASLQDTIDIGWFGKVYVQPDRQRAGQSHST